MTAIENPYQKKKTSLNANIHGLRGFAAFTVLIYHLYRGAISADKGHIEKGYNFWPDDIFHQLIAPVLSSLNAGIEIFFMISGYLITLTLVRHNSVKKFAFNRIIRIYPAFIATQIVMFSVGPVVGWGWMKSIGVIDFFLNLASNLLFLPGVFQLPIALPAAWTLSFEAAFYIISATIFVLSKKTRPIFIYAILSLIAFFVLMHYPRGIFFYVGVGVYLFVESALEEKLNLKNFAFLPIFSFLAIMIFLEFELYSKNQWFQLGTAFFGFLFFYFIVIGKGILSQFLRTQPLQFLGSISYSLYLWQVPIMFPIKRILLKFTSDASSKIMVFYSFSLISIIACLLVSYISFRVFEVYIPKKLKVWLT